MGDVGPETADTAIAFDSSAKLITQQNYHSMMSGVYYTSLGDFDSLPRYFSVVNQADELVYVEPKIWSDNKNNHSYMKHHTKKILLHLKGRKKIRFDYCPNDWDTMLAIEDVRKTLSPQLWISGCSISHGVGVEEHQRYGELLGKSLNLSVSFLTKSSTSIPWAADQILRSDIRKNDIVVWGLTSHKRYPYFEKTLQHVLTRYYELQPEFDRIVSLERLDDHNMIYQSLTKIYQVINFCDKIGAKLVLTSLLADNDFSPYVFNLPNTINLSPVYEFAPWMDLGTDGAHPGPKTHQWFADEIIKCL